MLRNPKKCPNLESIRLLAPPLPAPRARSATVADGILAVNERMDEGNNDNNVRIS